MSDPFRINGNIHSWGSLILKVDGEPFTGFTSVGFGEKVTVVLAYGMGKHQAPRARTRGKYEPEPVKIGGPPGSFQILREALAQLSPTGTSYGNVVFQGVLQYVETDETPITIEMGGLRWTANTHSHEESPDPLKEENEFSCVGYRRNGLVLFDDSGGSPFI